MTTANGLHAIVVILMMTLAGTNAVSAGHGCAKCGCRKVKKVTRLVQTFAEIEIPRYECSTNEVFHPAKGVTCHTGFRCDTYYKLHTCWCCKPCQVNQESCEDIEHYVDKNPCDCELECHTEHNEKEFAEYDIKCTWRRCVTCTTKSGCKTLLGACPNGCFKEQCIKRPTGEVCKQVVPTVKWVTFEVCPNCEHSVSLP